MHCIFQREENMMPGCWQTPTCWQISTHMPFRQLDGLYVYTVIRLILCEWTSKAHSEMQFWRLRWRYIAKPWACFVFCGMALRRHCKLFQVFRFQKNLKFGFELSRENAYFKKTKLASGKHFHDRCFLTYLNVGKWMEIRYCHTPFSKNFNKPVDHFLFLLAVLPYR